MRALLVVLILVGGCGPKVHWRWSSERGHACYASCRSEQAKCGDICGDPRATVTRDAKHEAVACHRSCLDAEELCRQRCPDLQLVDRDSDPVASRQKVRHPLDCWRQGICERGECFVRRGLCVRR